MPANPKLSKKIVAVLVLTTRRRAYARGEANMRIACLRASTAGGSQYQRVGVPMTLRAIFSKRTPRWRPCVSFSGGALLSVPERAVAAGQACARQSDGLPTAEAALVPRISLGLKAVARRHETRLWDRHAQ
jgi:hypothetical protein